MTHTLTLKQIKPVTHDTFHLTFDRPAGFDFTAGQATHFALDRDGWRDKDRAFTMTSLPDQADTVEFVIKSYPDHDGVTEQIAKMTAGDQVIAEAPAGAISDHGPGVFIAGGAGVTPFIPILKTQQDQGKTGRHLIFANKTDADIIMKDHWDQMDGLKTTYVIADQDDTAHKKGQLDKAMLSDLISDTAQPHYICGPGAMVDDIRDALKDIGVADENIITEDGW